MLKAKTFKDIHIDFDHSDSDDDNHHSHEDTLKKVLAVRLIVQVSVSVGFSRFQETC